MDLWRFFDITHREHVVWNPISIEKLEELIALLRLRPGERVLDIASGKGEFLVRLAERYGIEAEAPATGARGAPAFSGDGGGRLCAG